MVIVAVRLTFWAVAVIVNARGLLTGSVSTWNCAEVLPAGTVTVSCPVGVAVPCRSFANVGWSLTRLTVKLGGAGPSRVTVPCTVPVLPTTVPGPGETLLPGLSATLVSVGAFTTRLTSRVVGVPVEGVSVAVIVTILVLGTAWVVTRKFTLDCPARTVTVND